MPEEYTDEYREGWVAAAQGKPETTNPYEADDDYEAAAHLDWYAGWQAFHDGTHL